MYNGICEVRHQLTNSLIDTIKAEKVYKSKQGAKQAIKNIMKKYSDGYFGTVYVNYDYLATEI